VSKHVLNVLKIGALTLLISILADRVIYMALNHISDQVYSGQAVGKLNYFMDHKRDVETLFMGSSRTSRHFDSNLIAENSFNIGMDGKKIAYSATLLQILPENKKQTIIFQIDPIYAVDPLYTGSDLQALNIKFNRNKIFRENIIKMGQDNRFQSLYHSIAYNGNVVGLIANYLNGSKEYEAKNGYQPLKVSDVERQKLRIQIRDIETSPLPCPKDMVVSDIYTQYLKEMKQFAEQKRKKLIFITSPKHTDSCKLDNQKLKETMDSLGLLYQDDSDFFANDNNILYWKDLGHMSSVGSAKYAEHVKELIEKLNY